MEELDFSEEACIERYVTFACFDEDTETMIHIDGLGCDDPLKYALNTYGSINADWTLYETRPLFEAEGIFPGLRMAA